jgi:1-acyl-sn-glycerol-3-phosphate acyltransferase
MPTCPPRYLNLSKNIFIERGNTRSAIATMQEVSARMKADGLAVFMYPEGTRSYQTNHTLLTFKKGAFHLALEGDFDIIPIVSSTYHPVYSESLMRFERGTIHVRVCEPIRPQGRPLEAVMQETREVMLRALGELRTIPLEGSAPVQSASVSTSPMAPAASLLKAD